LTGNVLETGGGAHSTRTTVQPEFEPIFERVARYDYGQSGGHPQTVAVGRVQKRQQVPPGRVQHVQRLLQTVQSEEARFTASHFTSCNRINFVAVDATSVQKWLQVVPTFLATGEKVLFCRDDADPVGLVLRS